MRLSSQMNSEITAVATLSLLYFCGGDVDFWTIFLIVDDMVSTLTFDWLPFTTSESREKAVVWKRVL